MLSRCFHFNDKDIMRFCTSDDDKYNLSIDDNILKIQTVRPSVRHDCYKKHGVEIRRVPTKL